MAYEALTLPATGEGVIVDQIVGTGYIQVMKLDLGADGATGPLGFGQGAKTASISVTLASDDDAKVSLALLDDTVFSDDAAFTPATSKGLAIGGEADETSPDSVDEGDFGVVRITLARAFHVNLRNASGTEVFKNEDVGAAAADPLLPIAVVRRDTPVANTNVSNTEDYTQIIVDNFGKVWVTGSHAEDLAAGDGDRIMSMGAVRTDTPSANAGVNADGDYAFVRLDNLGKLWIAGAHAEDLASADGDRLLAMGAVRTDSLSANAGVNADGDYGFLRLDNLGALWTAGVAKEDQASADGDRGMVMLARRTGTPANQSGADGDYEFLQVSAGRLWASATIDAALPAGEAHIGGVHGSLVTVDMTFTRPANTTGYAANDAMSNDTASPTSGGFTFTGAARQSGGSGVIVDMVANTSAAPGTVLQGELWLFDQAVTNINDNSAFAITDAEASTLVGVIPFIMEQGTNQSITYVPNVMIGFTCVGTANLRALVKVKSSYTPANAEVFTFRLKILQVT